MKQHWENVYTTKTPEKMSWTQASPSPSLEWIVEALPKRGAVIDVGGGISSLVDHLLASGFERPAVLDISGAALDHARQRLGSRADSVEWIESDVTAFVPSRQFDLWHDRAVFHFLTQASDRKRYLENLKAALQPGGFVLMGTFAPEGPKKCSGLDVQQYDRRSLSAELGIGFSLERFETLVHSTPWGTDQVFSFGLFKSIA